VRRKVRRPPVPPREYALLGFRARLIVGIVFAGFYIGTFGPRSGFLPAIISGSLGGVVFFLLLKQVDERRKRRRR
jgi:hypothetical protein